MNISIIIPTYKGLQTLGSVYKSILDQSININNLEIITVLDGFDSELISLVESFQEFFSKENSKLKYIVHKKNRGRFEARMTGANIASNEHLVFVDDRTRLDNKFLEVMKGEYELNSGTAYISNVLESEHPNAISKLLFRMRRKIYKKWGDNFKDYEITKENFDKSPKGTAGLIVNRKTFLRACEEVLESKGLDDLHDVSDDTLLLKYILINEKLVKSGRLKIYYSPRNSTFDELVHFYNRGPKFVDYYLNKESPYFLYLVIFVFMVIILLSLIIVFPSSILYIFSGILALLIIFSVYFSDEPKDIVESMFALTLLLLFFGTGVLNGILKKAKQQL